ncbi:hypothetical protein Dimus_023099, partial [Dionaea muscipula]
ITHIASLPLSSTPEFEGSKILTENLTSVARIEPRSESEGRGSLLHVGENPASTQVRRRSLLVQDEVVERKQGRMVIGEGSDA